MRNLTIALVLILLWLGAILPVRLSAQTSADSSAPIQVQQGTGRCSSAGAAAAEFPEEASREGINFGTVDLQMTVSEGGALHDVTIVRSTNPVFNVAAVEAARRLHCENSTGAEIRLRYSLDFAMEGYEQQARVAAAQLHAPAQPVEQPSPPPPRLLPPPKPGIADSTAAPLHQGLDEPQPTDIRSATAARAAMISDPSNGAPIAGAEFLQLVSRLSHFDAIAPGGRTLRISLSSGAILVVDPEKGTRSTGKYRTENSLSELCLGELEPGGFAQISGCYTAQHGEGGSVVLASTSRSFRLVIRQSD